MLRVQQLEKVFTSRSERVAAVDGVSLGLAPGKVLTLLGPSGCGKTTTLRCIAGLEHPTAGEIAVGERIVFSAERRILVPPNQRRIGMVFQSYAIWPHMNVYDNVAFPLRVQGQEPTARHRELIERVLKTVELGGLATREATQLSGGQQQRLALARALVWQPELLLLDEPLSNLDARLREQMRFELKRLQQDLGVTTVYVTHDQSEALALSDTIAVMKSGRVVQLGTPHEIYDQPNSRFVAEFVGSTNLVAANLEGNLDGTPYHSLSTSAGRVMARSPVGRPAGAGPCYISIRPEDIALHRVPPAPAGRINLMEGRVRQVIFLGECVDYRIQVGELDLRARSHRSVELAEGDGAYLTIKPESCVVVSD